MAKIITSRKLKSRPISALNSNSNNNNSNDDNNNDNNNDDSNDDNKDYNNDYGSNNFQLLCSRRLGTYARAYSGNLLFRVIYFK